MEKKECSTKDIKAEVPEDTDEFNDQPVASMDEERSVNNQTSIVYSPRERIAPGMASKNKRNTFHLELG